MNVPTSAPVVKNHVPSIDAPDDSTPSETYQRKAERRVRVSSSCSRAAKVALSILGGNGVGGYRKW